ncbi:hypothetical protein R6Q59_036830 [Mikania micrantha]
MAGRRYLSPDSLNSRKDSHSRRALIESPPRHRLTDDRISGHHREIQTLLVDNQRLAATHVALKQELGVALQDLRQISAAAGKIKAERDADVRGLFEKAVKMEAEVRLIDEFKADLIQVRGDIQKLNSENKGFSENLDKLLGDLAKERLKGGQFVTIKAEIEAMHNELQRGRAAVEFEKKVSATNTEQSQAMEKSRISMAREIEKLQADLANANKKAMAAAAAAATNTPGSVYGAGFGNHDMGYGAYPGPYVGPPVHGGVDFPYDTRPVPRGPYDMPHHMIHPPYGPYDMHPPISDLGWPFTPSHKSSPYFATYVGSVLQGLLELSSTCSWLDRSVSGQIGRTRRFHLWKAPTPNGLSRCSHFLADPSCKRYAVRASAARFALQAPPPYSTSSSIKKALSPEEKKVSFQAVACWFFHHPRKRMKPGEKEMNTLLRNEASSLFFFKAPIRSRSPLLTGSRLISLPLATQMFQFAKFEKSKERRLATELGYGFPIGDPWITDGISPWPFASESVLPSQCPGIHPMHSFRSCTHGATKRKGSRSREGELTPKTRPQFGLQAATRLHEAGIASNRRSAIRR